MVYKTILFSNAINLKDGKSIFLQKINVYTTCLDFSRKALRHKEKTSFLFFCFVKVFAKQAGRRFLKRKRRREQKMLRILQF